MGFVAKDSTGWKKDNEKIKSSLVSFFHFDFGYDITRSTFIDLYPFVGLSLRVSSLEYEKPAELDPNYTNITNILIREQSVLASSAKLGFQAGLGMDIKLGSAKGTRSPIFFTKFGINRPITAHRYKVKDVYYKPEIRQGVWALSFGFKFLGRN